MFRDRQDAGRKLAARLSGYRAEKCIVYGLPRGGVPVAYEIALELKKPLEALIVRKIGLPGQEEVALGAITEGTPPALYFNSDLMSRLGMTETSVKDTVDRRVKEISEMQYLYRESGKMKVDEEAVALVVDDGIATGATMRAAVNLLKSIGQKKIVIAVPVSQVSVLEEMVEIVDEVVCLEPVLNLYAVGEFYYDFSQVSHETVIQMLRNSEEQLMNLPH